MHRILVADDSSTVRNVVVHAFRGTDVEVLQAPSGEEALAIVRRELPDLVLCDVVMLGMSGYEVAETLAADPATARIPVLLLTGAFEPFDEDRARRAGAVGYLSKPFDPRVLAGKVRELLGEGPPAEPGPGTAGREDDPAAPLPVTPPAVPAGPVEDEEEGPLDLPSAPAIPPAESTRARVPLPGDADFHLEPPRPPGSATPAGTEDREAEVRRIVERVAPGVVRRVAREILPGLLEQLLRERLPPAPRSPRIPGDEDR